MAIDTHNTRARSMGLLPPIIADNGDLLVDGGYVNNLPVDVMSNFCEVRS